VPALIAHATAGADRPAVHWIGHSMGGILAYAHLARGRSADVRHYGHFDLLMGRRAHAEVFPHIDRWLDEHDD
jgi:pimeloyl-ACP methyl ester carboxylesterase